MASLSTRIIPSPNEITSLQERFGLLPEHGVEYPQKGAILISRPPEGKVGVPISIFEACLRLPTMDSFDEVMRQYDYHVDNLTLNAVNKIFF